MSKTRILATPFGLQGHISPMIQLCKRLVASSEEDSIRITLVMTASTSSRLNISQSDDLRINIETVPDLTLDGIDHLDVYEIYFRVLKASIRSGIRAIVDKYNNDESGFRVKAIVYDSVMSWVLDVARENGLKGAVFFTQACSVSSVFYHIHKGIYEIPPKGDEAEISLPAMPVLRVRDWPSLVYDVGTYHAILKALIEQFMMFDYADWRLFNTFDNLEDEILKWMGTNNYKILTVGPTIPSMYTDKRINGNYEYGLSFFKSNDEQSPHHTKNWLDAKPDNSVIYVSFGSLANLGEKQIEELLQGLIDTEYSFLWAAREEESKVPRDNFSPDKGLVVNWCDQLQVLSHKAIGCFLTHCGWNSTLEAMVSGSPMVAMPRWADQPTNAKFVADVWRVGVRANDENGIVMREEVSRCVREVMCGGEGGSEIKRNVEKLKEMAIEAVSEGGSSDINVAKFVEELLNV